MAFLLYSKDSPLLKPETPDSAPTMRLLPAPGLPESAPIDQANTPLKSRPKFFGQSREKLECLLLEQYDKNTVEDAGRDLITRIEKIEGADQKSHSVKTAIHCLVAAATLEVKSLSVKNLFTPEFNHEGKEQYQNMLLEGIALTELSAEQIAKAEKEQFRGELGLIQLRIDAAREAYAALKETRGKAA